MNEILDSMLADLDPRTGNRATLGALARDAGHLLRPRKQRAAASFLREFAARKSGLEWLSDDRRAFEAGALFAVEEMLAAALAAMRTDLEEERQERATRTLAGRILDELKVHGSLRPSELADLLDVSGPQVSRALLHLRRRGDVQQLGSQPGEDRRTRRYSLAHEQPVQRDALEPVSSFAWYRGPSRSEPPVVSTQREYEESFMPVYPDNSRELVPVTTKAGTS